MKLRFLYEEEKRTESAGRSHNHTHGFTLVEMLVVIVLIGIMIGVGIPALRTAKGDALNSSRQAAAATLNTAAFRASLDGFTNGAGLHGTDKVAAMEWYYTNGYLTKIDALAAPLPSLTLTNGLWQVAN